MIARENLGQEPETFHKIGKNDFSTKGNFLHFDVQGKMTKIVLQKLIRKNFFSGRNLPFFSLSKEFFLETEKKGRFLPLKRFFLINF